MTSEERWIKIENAQKTSSELIARIIEMQARHEQKHDEDFARHEAAIRDLITVSRTLLDSQIHSRQDFDASRKRFEQEMAESRRAFDERMAETGRRLNALIEIVDEVIRRKKNGDG